MIRPEELRIGNYVMDRGGKLLKIDYWERAGVIAQNMVIEGMTVHPFTEDTKYLNPIPLTEEWLIKWQMPKRKLRTKKPGCDYSIRNNFEIYCYMDVSGNCLFWGVTSLRCHFFIRKCDTVHMFQNIYAILNPEEKLTIKQN